ncbi:hypothetical protein [Fuerstiella marisgermanici]|uniref:Uncharacterized protein n=1 Tax=Fuerstiella marisgermanici TaxID=1891926 RepID=A0A1P8WG90_9PLAN|nr:hypothetical protein [Fuerstiella marisgermanici]APZ93091.1 hypothetical protein Fuma_02707 [Fuerstiella marisgermanici]
MYCAVLSHGFGHGDGSGDDILFPLHRPLRIALNSEVTAEYIIYFTQYALYGLFLAVANRRGWLGLGCLVMVAFHVSCYAGRYIVADILQQAGF